MPSTLLTKQKVVDQQSLSSHGSAYVNLINVNDEIRKNDTLLCDVKLHKDAPEIDAPADAKLSWLRHQIIGGNTHTTDNETGDRTMAIFHEATRFVKKCLGGTQDDSLLFCESGTTAAIKRLQEVMGISIPSILRERVLNSCVTSEERWVTRLGRRAVKNNKT
ncbi:hypothetical protein L1887_28600 [Cichorium endivia]|nr:hypothetical protein L1887_28600 [Cichorium endivia]